MRPFDAFSRVCCPSRSGARSPGHRATRRAGHQSRRSRPPRSSYTSRVSDRVLYVYAITRKAATPRGEAIDRSENFVTIESAGVCAVATPVPAEGFSQEAIDGHAGDLEWLGAIGYRHQ